MQQAYGLQSQGYMNRRGRLGEATTGFKSSRENGGRGGAGFSLRSRQRRRSLAILMVALMWGVALFSAFHHSAGVAIAQTKGVPYTVHQGDTLWDIAVRSEQAGADTRAVVLEIMKMNHMQAAKIYAGEHLLLPNSK